MTIDNKEIKKIVSFLKYNKIKYRDINYYIEAFTHTSYVNEHPELDLKSYERMEFLGDAILGQEVVAYIYKKYPNFNEGELTLLKVSFISRKFLSKLAMEIKIQDCALLGRGQKNDTLNERIYGNIFESVVGAIYLDMGLSQINKFFSRVLFPQILSYKKEDMRDNKTKLQEIFQIRKGQSITYKLLEEKKVNGKYSFKVAVIFDDQILGVGISDSKKVAQQLAAEDALKKQN